MDQKQFDLDHGPEIGYSGEVRWTTPIDRLILYRNRDTKSELVFQSALDKGTRNRFADLQQLPLRQYQTHLSSEGHVAERSSCHPRLGRPFASFHEVRHCQIFPGYGHVVQRNRGLPMLGQNCLVYCKNLSQNTTYVEYHTFSQQPDIALDT